MDDTNPAQERRCWMAVLARAPRAALEEHWRAVEDPPRFVLLKPPEIGLVMVRARSGGNGAPFNLGEATMTRCVVQATDGTQGHAYVAGRCPERAEIAARFDALLQMPDRRERLLTAVIEPLEREQSGRRRMRWGEAARTRVEFLTMVRGD